jgi:hypothetical protein
MAETWYRRCRRSARDSETLQYFALEAYAYDISVPGVGCPGVQHEHDVCDSSIQISFQSPKVQIRERLTAGTSAVVEGASVDSETLQYFALEAYAYDISVPGVGCPGVQHEHDDGRSSPVRWQKRGIGGAGDQRPRRCWSQTPRLYIHGED